MMVSAASVHNKTARTRNASEFQAYRSNPQEYHKIKATLDNSCGDPWMKMKKNFQSPSADYTENMVNFDKNMLKTIQNGSLFPRLQEKIKSRIDSTARSKSMIDDNIAIDAVKKSKYYMKQKVDEEKYRKEQMLH